MKFELIEKVETRVFPKFPDRETFCCEALYYAMKKDCVFAALDDRLMVKITNQKKEYMTIKYCPFCGEKIECQQVN